MIPTPKKKSIEELKPLCQKLRREIIEMIHEANSGHPGGSLSLVEILASLFFHTMAWDPKNEHSDRVVLSKGHGVPTLYAIFAELAIVSHAELKTLRKIGSRLQGHPDRVLLPEVEASTGSLGQGLSIAQGMALARKLSGSKAKVFCVMGDGESQEGQVWETAMSAPKFKLNNLIAILDNNNGQIDGHVTEVMDLAPIADKWRSFKWNVISVDGHDLGQLIQAYETAMKETEKPTLIHARTVKGKGVSFMENNIGWHGSAPNAEETKKALKELGGN